MKKLYHHKNRVGWKWILLFLFIGITSSFQDIGAQVRVPFTQRTSTYSTDTKVYNIKGDFTMIGNTNLTLRNYSDNGSNNANMDYVDVDGDPNTLNSSSATLTFSTEGGVADPNCSNIIYAGLYWTGRAHNGTSPNAFTIGGSTDNRYNTDSFNGYTLSIAATDQSQGSGTSDGRIATYTFTPSGGENKVVFRFRSWNSGNSDQGSVTVQIGNGTETALSGDLTSTSNNNYSFTFNTPYGISSGSQTIFLNSLEKRRTNNSINDNYRASVTSDAKLLNKRQVKLKKAGDTYQTITANSNDIYYPTADDGYMYSAYAEVTDYVKANGLGEYFVADIALQKGNGGGTGFYGGWGLIVVYENSKMKWRDVTLFDGHAYVAGGNYTYELPVSGFNTVQQGPVDVKLGLMAGEGDVGISGDQFKIRNAANSNWVNLSHGDNTTNNFFNSSIYTGGNARNPNLKNNTGLDISMFTLNNDDKSLMTNNQTSTRFQYNSTQDTYIIFCIAMAVDAYIPEVQSENNVISVNDIPYVPGESSTTVYPNDEIEYTVFLKNLGTEAVKDGKIIIPVPFTTTYMSSYAEYFWQGNPSMSGTVTYDPALGGTGSIIWNIGNIPLPVDKDEVLAKLTYRLKVTNDCFILNNASCITVSVDGTTTGTGVTSGVSFTNNKFITGFIKDGSCDGQPVYEPVNFNIDATDYLATSCTVPEGEDPDYYTRRKFKYCGLSAGGTIPFTDVSPNFPKGSKFYSKVNKDVSTGIVTPADDAIQYTSATGFPVGTFGESSIYYAIPPGMYITCYWEFIIIVDQYCSNYWHGTESTNWAIANNWTAKKVPDTGEDIEFATAVNNSNNPAQRDLYLDKDRVIGNLINNSDMNMVVTTGNQLVVNGSVQDANAAKGTIIVKTATDSPTGTLLFKNPLANTAVNATVEFYNKAYECATCGFYKKQWQYFGIPVSGSAFPSTGVETVNQWVEPYNGNKWRPAPYTPDTELKAFKGYEITNSTNAVPTRIYSFSGKLNVGDADVAVTNSLTVNYPGMNLIANSYTAAIPISKSAIVFGAGLLADETVYLFNTGSRDDWRKLNGSTVSGVSGGQYQAVPINLAGQNNLPDRILSMHTFMVNAAVSGSVKLKYSELVKNELVNQTAWRSSLRSARMQLPYVVMDVIGDVSADRVWLFENEEATAGFDTGWDGYKLLEEERVQVYVEDYNDAKYQIATVNNLIGTAFGVGASPNEGYSISLSVAPEVESRNFQLKDLYTGRTYPLVNNAEYVIPGVSAETASRFKIVDTTTSLIEDKWEAEAISIHVENNRMIIRNLSSEDCDVAIYDVLGRFVAKKPVTANSEGAVDGALLSKGVYIVKILSETKSINKTQRVLIK